MSLENSQYTFHTLQTADKAAFRKEVDRITKEADHVESSDDEAPTVPTPAKRGRFTQSQDSSSSSQRPGHRQPRAVSGIVLEVVLEDFLCHTHYSVTLNKEINFIVGRNGSGKSAILTALVVALGGNATTTGRGVALKDFVKHGSPFARVTCVVSNAGVLNFKREEYGEKIIVVRKIYAEGGSTIQLKSEKGKRLSSKMEDLRAMTLHLGIQVDNPISILDQNTARHFLNQSKPSNKFELFMRATNLETLQIMYVEITLAVDKINQEIHKKERQLVDNNAEVLEIQRKYEMIQSLETDRVQAGNLKMELLWAEVRDTMIALVRAQKELEKVQREKEHLDSTLSSEKQSEPLLQELESAKADAKALEDQRQEIDKELKDLKIKVASIGHMRKKCLQDKQQIENRLKSDARIIEEYKAEISSQENKLLPEHVAIRRQQMEEIRNLQRMLEQHERDRSSKEAESKELNIKAVGMNDTVDQHKRIKRKLEEDLRNYNTKLQEFQATESNLSLFGPCMPELVRQIEASSRFKKKPVGPLGSYVKLKDPKWALALESLLKPRLLTFVVDNLEDERLLQGMVNRICTRGSKPGIIRTNFPTRPFDTSRQAARTSDYCSALDVVEISNVVAQNMLIDLLKIESVMLIPTDDECYQLLSNRQRVPKNCVKALTLNADEYFPAPNYRTYASNQRSVQVLQTSRDGAIRELTQKINEVQDSLKAVNQSLSDASNELHNTSVQMRQTRIAANNSAKLAMETKTRLENLKDVEQADTHSMAELKEELAEKERKQEENTNMLQEFPAKLKAYEEEVVDLKQKYSELNRTLAGIDEQRGSFISKQKSVREQLDEIKSAQVNKKRKLEQVKKLEEQHTSECQKLIEKHAQGKADAEKYEHHLQSEAQEKNIEFKSLSDTKRNLKVIDQELRALNKKLASMEKTLGQDVESTEKEYNEKLGAYNHTKLKIKDFKTNVAYLKHALNQRKSLYHTQKNLTCAVVSHQFTRVLRFRSCSGNVKVNFENRTLDIGVGPIDEGERAGLGTSSLSGGERSYATMAFVIALWNVTELPFYFLDEFDVFMDMLNRQTVLTLLLRFAKQKSGYQFGFLTPLDTTAVKGSARVSIFKLSDPRSD